MHHSRLCEIVIDCRTGDLDSASAFWSTALGRPVNLQKSGDPQVYRLLEGRPGEIRVEVQKVEHESRVHLDIETDDIPAEVKRLEKLGAKVAQQLPRWVVMQAPTGQRFCVVNAQSADFPNNANRWD
jgi:predicted enzyme related to lactoylglutathione lyase